MSSCTHWIATQFCTDIRGPQMLNANNFSEPFTFPLAPLLDFVLNVSTALNGLR